MDDITDLFGVSTSPKLNSKWSISSFVSNPRSRSTSVSVSGVSEDVQQELERSIKAIESSYSRSSLDFDKMFRDLTARRKELKMLLTKLEATAKPVDVAALWSVESSLIVNQIRALENKQKIESEKFKQIRDEKKLFKDKSPAAPADTNQEQNMNIMSNSPIATVENLNRAQNVVTPISIGNLPESAVLTPTSMFKQVEEATRSVAKDLPKESVSEANKSVTEENTRSGEPAVKHASTITNVEPENQIVGDVKPSEKVVIKDDEIVTTDMTGDTVVRVSDLQADINEKVRQRLARGKDKILSETPTMTGYNYKHSLDTIETKSIPHVEKLFICPDTGEYYCRAYTMDEDGKYTKEIPNFPLKSITHIGQLSINPMHKKATFYYYPDPKDFVVVDSMDDAPEFYKQEWSDPKTEKFRLDGDVCAAIAASVNA